MQFNEEQLILIARHFKGETSFDEEKLISQWLEESDQATRDYKELQFLWDSGRKVVPAVPDIDKAWNKVKLQANLGSSSGSEKAKVRTLERRNYFLKIAASLLIVLTATIFAVTQFGKEEMTVIVSGNERKEVLLPDSSTIWLNRNSKLSYSASDFNEKQREVFLEGEAFFEVTKDPSKPFIIQGFLSRTEVLGTSFNIRSISGEKKDVIQVMTGKVSFEHKEKNKEKVVLLPGDKASVQDKGSIEKWKVEDLNALAWKNDQLIFENASLKEVTETAENYFHIDIEIADSNLSECRFTGTFTKPQLEEMMKVLSVSMNLSYSKADSAYVLTGEGCTK